MRPQVWLVAGDCCLIGLQPVLVHLSKAGKDSYAFHPVSLNFLVEVAKTSVAIVVLLAYVSLLPTCQQVSTELDQLQVLILQHSRSHTSMKARNNYTCAALSRPCKHYEGHNSFHQSLRQVFHSTNWPDHAGDWQTGQANVLQHALFSEGRSVEQRPAGASRAVLGQQLAEVHDAAVLQSDDRQNAGQPQGEPSHCVVRAVQQGRNSVKLRLFRHLPAPKA